MKQILKTSLISGGTLGVGYYIAQREYDYSLGIYDALFSQLFKTAPWYAVQFMKFMSFQNLFWKQQISADSKTVGELTFKNQLGLASGFDNDGTLIESLQNLGFGFIEIGSITAQKSITVNEDINQYSLKNNTIEYFSELQQMGILKTKAMLTSLRRNYAINVPIGVNIMPSEDIYKYTPYLIPNDIGNITRELCTLADYLTLNLVSGTRTSKLYNEIISNNLPLIQEMIQTIKIAQTEEIGLQAALEYESTNQIQGDELVSNYLSTIKLGLKQSVKTPLFVKISSNQSKDVIDYLVASAMKNDIQGIVIQKDQNQMENDHLQQLKQMRVKLPTNCTLISVGGINSKRQYQDRLKSGADACQILSSFIQKGPKIIKDIIL